jgi:hypothetical protein
MSEKAEGKRGEERRGEGACSPECRAEEELPLDGTG